MSTSNTTRRALLAGDRVRPPMTSPTEISEGFSHGGADYLALVGGDGDPWNIPLSEADTWAVDDGRPARPIDCPRTTDAERSRSRTSFDVASTASCSSRATRGPTCSGCSCRRSRPGDTTSGSSAAQSVTSSSGRNHTMSRTWTCQGRCLRTGCGESSKD